jgi:hypothetical protein
MPVVTRHKPIGTPNNEENKSEEQSHLFISRPSPPDIKLCDPVMSELWLQIDELTDKQG